MQSRTIDRQTAPKYLWGGKCESFVLLDTQGLSVKQETMPANTKEQWHHHNKAQQFFYILKGEATFYLTDEVVTVGEQQGISIEPGKKHYIENKSSAALEFLVISQPSTNNDRVVIGQ